MHVFSYIVSHQQNKFEKLHSQQNKPPYAGDMHSLTMCYQINNHVTLVITAIEPLMSLPHPL